jgi:hypothetical protein
VPIIMSALLFLLMLIGLVPLARAWRANRHTSLVQTLHWAITAWLVWMASVLVGENTVTVAVAPARYLALCLTGCAGVAVLGARRPHVGAWNFVVLGLLAVLLLPLVEGLLIREQPPGVFQFCFLGAVLSVGIVNYLPTCFGAAALVLAVGSAVHLLLLMAPEPDPGRRQAAQFVAQLCLILVPWVAVASWGRSRLGANEFDRLWLRFRNRFGLVWGQRVREQFNRSAENAGWPVYLTWRGLRRSGETATVPSTDEVVETLRALLKRFEEA